jgi:hypothetical protein
MLVGTNAWSVTGAPSSPSPFFTASLPFLTSSSGRGDGDVVDISIADAEFDEQDMLVPVVDDGDLLGEGAAAVSPVTVGGDDWG